MSNHKVGDLVMGYDKSKKLCLGIIREVKMFNNKLDYKVEWIRDPCYTVWCNDISKFRKTYESFCKEHGVMYEQS